MIINLYNENLYEDMSCQVQKQLLKRQNILPDRMASSIIMSSTTDFLSNLNLTTFVESRGLFTP